MRTLPLLALLLSATLNIATAEPSAEISPTPSTGRETERQAERELMLLQLKRHGSGVTAVSDPHVLAAMAAVPRHRFVPALQRSRAYQDRPLPIGHGQTISQPYIVALMTQLLALEPGMKVLEVGTGSGYQAAVLAAMGAHVYSLEIIAPLAASAGARLRELGYAVTTAEGDGYYGWREHAPFDRIAVTAAAAHIPPPLVEQLAPGGHMVIPVGPRWGAQTLMLVSRDAGGGVSSRSLLPVIFVPLVGGPDGSH